MVGLVGLLVIGPERLPRAARIAGFWLGKTQRMAANLKAEIHRELQVEDMRQLFEEQSALKDYRQLYDEVSDTAHEVRSSLWKLSEPDGLKTAGQIPGRIYDDMSDASHEAKSSLWWSPKADGVKEADQIQGDGSDGIPDTTHEAKPLVWQPSEADGVKTSSSNPEA